MFQGSIPALVTPFNDDNDVSLDMASFDKVIEWQLASGVDAICVCGSTGESATLTDDERIKLIKRTVEIVNGQIPVIAGTGTNCTKKSVELTKAARELGADAALIVAPYYNKPTQEGIYQHYAVISKQSGLPLIAYNIPGRSVIEMTPQTIGRLAKDKVIVAIKHAVDSASKMIDLVNETDGKIALLAGDDPLVYHLMAIGGTGVISTTAAVFPKVMLDITQPALNGNMTASLAAQRRAVPVINSLFVETNPIPAKAALQMMGIIASDNMRLPLTRATENTRNQLREVVSFMP
jgi:4-hydroxy-tetrahydrodipicolinate synthase